MYLITLIIISLARRIDPVKTLHLSDHLCLTSALSDFLRLQSKWDLQLNLTDPQPHHSCPSLRHYWSLGESFKYGNWCGKNHGGFNNECLHVCSKNHETPSPECVRCNPPIDWVDEQCMYHDFCFQRFQVYGEGSADQCDGTVNLGNPFPTPCSCSQNITYYLRTNMLILYCKQSVSCLANGEIIHDFFSSDSMKCSCYYKVCNNNTIDEDGNPIKLDEPLECHNRSACVQVDQCSALQDFD